MFESGSVSQWCPILCDLMDYSMPAFPVLHYLMEFAQIHVSWVIDAIQTSHPLLPLSPPPLTLSQHQGLFYESALCIIASASVLPVNIKGWFPLGWTGLIALQSKRLSRVLSNSSRASVLECEVKWALGNITTNKASGGDGILTELFKILKDDAIKVCLCIL